MRVRQLLRVGPLDQELVRRAELRREPPFAEYKRRVAQSRIVGDPLQICENLERHVRQKQRLTANAMHIGLFVSIGDALYSSRQQVNRPLPVRTYAEAKLQQTLVSMGSYL